MKLKKCNHRDGKQRQKQWKLEGLPPLSASDYDELKQAIRDHQTIVPTVHDTEGNVIDGEHRNAPVQSWELSALA